MRKIASAAGVSPSTLYEIYGSKESLILYSVGNSISALALEEEQYAPGLDRFLHRLESVASFFEDTPDTGEAMAMLLFQNAGDSPAKEIFLVNAIKARSVSIAEMCEEKELNKDLDIDFYSRALVSVTWGTVLYWLKGILSKEDLGRELIKCSLAMLLPVATRKSKGRMLEILNASGPIRRPDVAVSTADRLHETSAPAQKNKPKIAGR